MSFSFIQITDHHLGASERDHLHGYATSAALARVLDHIDAMEIQHGWSNIEGNPAVPGF